MVKGFTNKRDWQRGPTLAFSITLDTLIMGVIFPTHDIPIVSILFLQVAARLLQHAVHSEFNSLYRQWGLVVIIAGLLLN